MNMLCGLCDISWNFTNPVTRHDYRDDNSQIWNQLENVHGNCKTTRETILNEKLVYGINSSFKHAISVRGGFATYRDLLNYV